jgi:hypothetical protein
MMHDGQGNDPCLTAELDFDGMDTPAEQLAEAVGINVPAAERALAWMAERSQQHHDHDMSDTILRLLQLITPGTTSNPFTIGLRCTALRWLIRSEGEPITKIAAECGVSKQLLDHHIRDLENKTGIHNPAQKGPHTVKIYQQASIQSWARTKDRVRRRNAKRNRQAVAECYAAAGLREEQDATPAAQI